MSSSSAARRPPPRRRQTVGAAQPSAEVEREPRGRSRSPRGGEATASGILRTLDIEKMQLRLDERIVKVLYFKEDDIWFEARPLILFLEYCPTNISYALGIVKAKNKSSLKELLDARGPPKWVDVSDTSTPTYHDLRALYINEPGLYSLIFKSNKPQAQDFQDWVYEDVLTSIRRKGVYGDSGVVKLTSEFRELSKALQERDEGLRQLLRQRDDSLWQAARESFFDALGNKLAAFMQMSLAGHISKVVGAAVRDAFALKKAQPKKASKNSVEMPEDQRATPAETGPQSLPLSCMAMDIIPDLPFFVWKELQLGSSFGRRAKAERLRRHGLGAAHPDFVAKPLLWSFTGGPGGVEGGGSRYIYLRRDYAMLRQVFCTPMVTTTEQRRAGAPRPTESLEQRARRLAAGLTPAQRAVDWPIHVADIEPSWTDMKVAEV